MMMTCATDSQVWCPLCVICPLAALTCMSLLYPAGASQCSPGFWATKGSLKPCQECPEGRTTLNEPAFQSAPIDCIVKPGHGVVNSSATGLAMFAIDTSNIALQVQATLPVLECPIGYYGVGGETGSTCTPCPCGSTTTVAGAKNETECSGKYCYTSTDACMPWRAVLAMQRDNSAPKNHMFLASLTHQQNR